MADQKNDIEIAIELITDKLDQQAKEVTNTLRDSFKGTTDAIKDQLSGLQKNVDAVKKLHDTEQKHSRASEQSATKKDRHLDQEERRKQRIEKTMQRIRRMEQEPMMTGGGVAAAIIAGGGQLTHSAIGFTAAQFAVASGNRYGAGKNLSKAQTAFEAAQQSGDPNQIREAGSNLESANSVMGSAQAAMVQAAVQVAVAVITRVATEATRNESVERRLYQATGKGAGFLGSASAQKRLADIGLVDARTAAELATSYGKATGTKAGGSSFEDMLRVRKELGDETGQAIMGEGGALRARGGIARGGGEASERAFSRMMAHSVAIGTEQGLDRGDFDQIPKALSALAESLPVGVKANTDALEDILRRVGIQSPQLAGAGGVPVAQALMQAMRGEGGNELMNAASLSAAMELAGPGADARQVMLARSEMDQHPELIAKQLRRAAGVPEGKELSEAEANALFMGMGGGQPGAAPRTEAMMRALMGGKPGALPEKPSDALKALPGGEMPEKMFKIERGTIGIDNAFINVSNQSRGMVGAVVGAGAKAASGFSAASENFKEMSLGERVAAMTPFGVSKLFRSKPEEGQPAATQRRGPVTGPQDSAPGKSLTVNQHITLKLPHSMESMVHMEKLEPKMNWGLLNAGNVK